MIDWLYSRINRSCCMIDWLYSRIPVDWVWTWSLYILELVSVKVHVPAYDVWRELNVYGMNLDLLCARARSVLPFIILFVVQIMWHIQVYAIYTRNSTFLYIFKHFCFHSYDNFDYSCQPFFFCLLLTVPSGNLEKRYFLRNTVERGEEGQPHQSLVRTTFSPFSRPNYLELLVLSILFFLSVRSLKINTFFKNMATLGHKTLLE